MYCQFCGKEIENGSESCSCCGKLLPNTYIPVKKEEEKEEKEEKKELKKPSPVALKVTGIVMYALTFAGFLYEFISVLAASRTGGRSYLFEICGFGALSALFLIMLLTACLSKMNKRLAGTALIAVNLLGIGHLIRELSVCIYALRDFEGFSKDWYLLMFFAIYSLLIIGLTVITVFAFLFYYKKKFSPLPMCITTGVHLIFEILSLTGSLAYWIIKFGGIDIRTSIFFLTTFVFFGITIAQLFLYHSQDKYNCLNKS